MITLGTAHPVKFAEAIEKAGLKTPDLPHHLTDLFDREERLFALDNELAKVQEFVAGIYGKTGDTVSSQAILRLIFMNQLQQIT